MHQNRASPFASDFYRRGGYRREFRSEDQFLHIFFANRGSLAIFFAEEIAHLGVSKNRAIVWGAVKIAAAAAENRAILVHSGQNVSREFGGGGNVLQSMPPKPLWRACKIGGWSGRCLFPFKGNMTESRQERGGQNVSQVGGSRRFWGGVLRYVPPPPPEFSTPLGRSLKVDLFFHTTGAGMITQPTPQQLLMCTVGCTPKGSHGKKRSKNLVNLLLTNLVRISGFS